MLAHFPSPDILQYLAYKRTWSIFSPDDVDEKNDVPSLAWKEHHLLYTLLIWAINVQSLIQECGEESDPQKTEVDDDTRECTRMLLESLSHATDVLLTWSKLSHPIELPPSVIDAANQVFEKAEAWNVQAKQRSIFQLARRLAAAEPKRENKSQTITVDSQGRIYGEDGKRRFDIDPSAIRKGTEDITAGRSSSLQMIQRSEA
ncbi:hypothetical protein SAMN05444166_2797 [Singulisphaera sp. GP187]|uniref:hypothetical protein n=1 Tax=Singulisphaera sp. GP187 TaxID=1882752 RepID=UPI0009288B0F|nr:hypothetical protein [Singulisphaera sp. GP187]SIO16824.1 hypothetical protein SAMN05444166_2797 [Singulisphaera sp. GP187]